MEENMSLSDFLRQRGVNNETIKYIEEENIDASVIQAMEEDTLTKLIPRFGDRIALLEFCKKKSCPQKYSLIEKLRLKINKKNERVAKMSEIHESDKTSENAEKKSTRKSTRYIEVGWMIFNKKKQKLIQVRARQGGGTRKLQVDRFTTCEDVQNRAIDLFFPDKKSTKGHIKNFKVSLLDFKCYPIDLSLTIDEIYKKTGISRLKLYLSTENVKATEENSDSEEDDESSVSNIANSHKPSTQTSESIESTNEMNDDYHSDERPSTSGRIARVSSTIQSYVEDYSWEDDHLQDYPLFPEIGQKSQEITLLVLHRGKIFEELLHSAKDDALINANIQIEMILPNGKREVAEDMGGVYRDALTEFWSTFYDKCSVGTNFKVPYLRNDFDEIEWCSIGKIIGRGWADQRYFPIQLAPVFMLSCFEDYQITDEELISDFKKYVCESDSEIINNAIDIYEVVDQAELLTFFTNFDTKSLPTKDNVKRLIVEAARKELIQKPAYVSAQFRKYLMYFPLPKEIKQLYSDLLPTAKNIIEKLEVVEKDLTKEKIEIVGYLKKYLKEASPQIRAAFSRFCTGSDIVNRNINISFINTTGFSRMPIGHTCSCLLEVPSTYQSFVEFRSEFNNVLNSNIWIMDIV